MKIPCRCLQLKAFMLIWMGMMVAFTAACTVQPEPSSSPPVKSRLESIPVNAVKMTPENDPHPPLLHSDLYHDPVPLGRAINTAGAEDSAFIMPDGHTLYFWFTPDVTVPPEEQLLDGVTGIYVAKREGDGWQAAQRVVLQEQGELALDGAPFVLHNTIWFCSARKGNYRELDIWIARQENGVWANWENAGELLNAVYDVGELHITADGLEMYFHSPRPGGKGQNDIWVTRFSNGRWQEPENVTAVNSPENEGFPFITQDGSELWFSRNYRGTPAIFVSRKINGRWSEPEMVISQFAAEPSLDTYGNIYFTHHYFVDGKMVEADIYVAYRR